MTLLFSDIEGSTRLWEDHPELMRDALARHDELMSAAVESAGGFVFKTVGDAFCVAFPTASAAIEAAVMAQRALAAESWPDPVEIRDRMGLHSGECVERDGDFFGPTVNRAARLEATAHGGQIVLSATTRLLLGGALPSGTALRDLGEHRLKDLSVPERVFQVDIDGLPGDFPPLRSLDNPQLPNNLPLYTASFVGRDAEIAAVRDLVAGSRLVTLTGPGGGGKTRLAIQVAADLLDSSGDGAWIVDLAPVTDKAMVPTTIADSLGVRTSGVAGSIDGLLEVLADRRLVVVLDNCEHLIDAVAATADHLIRSCVGIDLIATSREPLGIAGEVVYRVPSLGLPDASVTDPEAIAQTESVRLFAERARLHDASFAVDTNNAAAVAAVCRRLDGIPLALELAAARLRSISAAELLGRLDQRFRLLTGGSRTAMARQQTLRATIDWSFELLDQHERTLLTYASVFAGGWDLAAAEAVTADGSSLEAIDVVDLLTSLVDKSLVSVESSEVTRYRMLETMREYAAEKLAATGADANLSLRRRHLAHYLSLAELAAPQLRTGEQRLWLDRLEADHDNLRAALVAASEVDEEEAGLRLGIALGWYVFWRGRVRDLVEPLAVLIDNCEPEQPLVADAQLVLALMQIELTEYAQAAVTLEKTLASIRKTGDGRRLADALWTSAWLGVYSGDLARAEAHGTECLAVAEAIDDLDRLARSHGVVAVVHGYRLDLAAARRHYKSALAGHIALGDRAWEGACLNNFGDTELEFGDIDRADESFETCEAIARELNLPDLLAIVILNRATVADLRGEHASALARAVEGLSLVHRHSITRMTASALLKCARALSRTEPDLAAQLHGALRVLAPAAFELGPLSTRLRHENAARLRATLGDETYEACCEAGGGLSTHELLALTRAQSPSHARV